MPFFPVPGDDPALISSYVGNDNEDSTFKRSKEQPDETTVVSLARWSFEDGGWLIDRQRSCSIVNPRSRARFSRCAVSWSL
jgi:hypothetical protein